MDENNLQTEYTRLSTQPTLPKNHISYLRTLKASGFSPKVIYDIGANLLHWTNEVRQIWPDAQIILFDAFDKTEFLYKNGGYTYHIGVLSNVDDAEVKFYYNDNFPGGNSYYKEHNDDVFPEDRFITLKTERLDTVVERLGLPLPDLVKIDVQGADRDVFEGGQKTIGHAEHLIVELQKVYYNLGAPLVHESLSFMEERGWKCIAPLFCDNGPDGDYGFMREDLCKSEQRPTICLNMIVKNESHIITKTLEMLCAKIRFDYWVICDTGSSDDTPKIITDFFQDRGIPGELHHDPWKNFAHNRTLALEYAFNKTDLLLIFDADDELHGEIQLPKKVLFDQYRFIFGKPGTSVYTRPLLINNHRPYKFVSVLHELLECKEEGATQTTLEGNYYVVSGRSGARSKNPNKYLDDAILLENAYAEAKEVDDHLYKRYSFYCANSYKDAGKFEKAIDWYKVTLKQDNWCQEKYICCLSLYDCYTHIKQREQGFYYLVESFKYDNERVECLNHLLSHYTCTGQNDVAYSYYKLSKNVFDRMHKKDKSLVLENKLFASTSEFYFYVPYLMIVISDRMKDHATGIQMYEIIFDRKLAILSDFHIKNLIFNLQFFTAYLEKEGVTESFFAKMNEYFAFLNKHKYIQTGIDDVLIKFKNKYGLNSELILPPTKNIIKECEKSRNILFFVGFSECFWNKTYLNTHSLGGSEKAVIYLADKLSSRGYKVYVSGAIEDEVTDTGVTYVHMDRIPQGVAFHTVILSRYLFFLERYSSIPFHQLFIWAHDTYLLPYGTDYDKSENIVARWKNVIDGCVCLSEWQQSSYASVYPELKDKIRIINNGIQYTKIRGPPTSILVKQKNKFIYTSCAERGLKILLDLWPEVLRALPDAELTISSYNKFPKTDEEKEMERIIAEYPNSIRHLGRLNTDDLYSELRTAEYWLYPCTFYETSCITAMEMLAAEVICLYYPLAGLTNTMAGCGLQVSRGTEVQTLLSLTEERKAELRSIGTEYIQKCDWENRATEWIDRVLS